VGVVWMVVTEPVAGEGCLEGSLCTLHLMLSVSGSRYTGVLPRH
jgi:hypothetical protein